MSFKPVIKTGSDPKFYDNAQRFATHKEAELMAKDIFNRWLAAVEWGVEESTDPVNYRLADQGDRLVLKTIT